MKRILIIAIAFLAVLISCKKNESNEQATSSDNVTIRPNVYVVDSTKMSLNNDSLLISQGKFEFTLISFTPIYQIGDIIVVATNGGYLRKILAINNASNKVTYTTADATMAEVFEKGSFGFNINSDSLIIVQRGVTLPLDNIIVYQNGNLSIMLNAGSINFDPNWKFDFDFNFPNVKSFQIGCENAFLNGAFDLTVSANQSASLINHITTLKKYRKYFVKIIGGKIPVIIQMDVKFNVRSDLSINGAISRRINFTMNNTFNLGIKYENNQWNGIYNLTPSNNFTLNQSVGTIGLNYNFYLYPEVSFKLYNAIGPYASVALRSKIEVNQSLTSLDWDQNIKAWIESTVGINGSILGNTIPNYNKTWSTDSLKYFAPDTLKKISGDNQIGQPNVYLSLPIKTRVVDTRGKEQSGVPVYFTVTTGGGSVLNAMVLTDINGYAETLWKLGTQATIQNVSAKVKKANGITTVSTVVDFAATITPNTCGSISDIDGNTYNSVTIGTQCWTKENLNTTKYRNGDIIPQVTDSAQWSNLTTGAWCYYNNDPSTASTYGRLYNKYALNDSRNIAPAGWHIPNYNEFQTLITYLGGDTIAGGKLKATNVWSSPNTGATNSSGFSSLPGGARHIMDNYTHPPPYYLVDFAGMPVTGVIHGTNANITLYHLYKSVYLSNGTITDKIGAYVRLIKD